MLFIQGGAVITLETKTRTNGTRYGNLMIVYRWIENRSNFRFHEDWHRGFINSGGSGLLYTNNRVVDVSGMRTVQISVLGVVRTVCLLKFYVYLTYQLIVQNTGTHTPQCHFLGMIDR